MNQLTNLNRPWIGERHVRPDKEASRYGFVLSNQTNLNRPRIGESEANPESRVAGTPGKNA